MDNVGTAGGQRFVILRRPRAVHRPCTAPVDREVPLTCEDAGYPLIHGPYDYDYTLSLLRKKSSAI